MINKVLLGLIATIAIGIEVVRPCHPWGTVDTILHSFDVEHFEDFLGVNTIWFRWSRFAGVWAYWCHLQTGWWNRAPILNDSPSTMCPPKWVDHALGKLSLSRGRRWQRICPAVLRIKILVVRHQSFFWYISARDTCSPVGSPVLESTICRNSCCDIGPRVYHIDHVCLCYTTVWLRRQCQEV